MAVLLQTFSQLFLLTAFYMQRDFIASVFCENKDQLQMNCKGKCYLNKQLKKQEQQERELPGQVSKIKPDVFVTNLYTLFQANPFYTTQHLFIEFKKDELAGVSKYVFRPPIRIALSS